MYSGNYIFFLLQTIFWTLVAGEDPCRCRKHILCLYPGSSPARKCDRHIESGLTWKEKMAIVNATNSFRSRIAMGKESSGDPGPQPSAADMMEVTWDDYLGVTSQRWADQCELLESEKLCRFRGGGDFLERVNEYFGENIAWKYHFPGIVGHEYKYHDGVFLEMIKSWEDEVKHFPRGIVDNFNSFWERPKIDIYAQLVNGKTYAIGCGRTRSKYFTYFVCHYKPGNFGIKPLYTRGEPGSKCPNGSIASKYEGLCAFEQYSGVSKNSHSAILIPTLFALVVMANKIQQFTAIAHY